MRIRSDALNPMRSKVIIACFFISAGMRARTTESAFMIGTSIHNLYYNVATL
ncbi:hypothetical protein [Bartonella doshiae]|uniref:hypothetical protein n=1 Tax=Bartonella doshiae TaxID=33044 RepID=UPI0002D87028|nr:hypothetical protein [Bartonella doshiae]MBB6160071.1 hypothetical protein [Bartonella doshiae]